MFQFQYTLDGVYRTFNTAYIILGMCTRRHRRRNENVILVCYIKLCY